MKTDAKQIIVIRKDLKMRRGKEIAQGAHASLAVVLDQLEHVNSNLKELWLDPESALSAWIHESFKKITVTVDSEQQLLEVYENAKKAGLLCSLIRDSGLTEFGGVLTYTTVAIGPAWNEELQPITGHLKLY